MDTLKYRVIMEFTIQYAVAQKNETKNETLSDAPDLTMFQDFFSPTAFFNLGKDTTGYPEFSIRDKQPDTRRIYTWMENMFTVKHYGSMDDKIQACYYLQVTYRNALTDLRRYFFRRILYKNTLEYEVGFLTHEIIWRYQTILEIYHFISTKYWKHRYRNFAPPSMMFYFYGNVVEHGMMIVHLCNMMHELERKYRGAREKGAFDDYDISSKGRRGKKSFNSSASDDRKAEYEEYIRQRIKEQKKAAKERKKIRKQLIGIGKTTTRGKAKPFKSKWPLHYGWSIENW